MELEHGQTSKEVVNDENPEDNPNQDNLNPVEKEVPIEQAIEEMQVKDIDVSSPSRQ